MDTYDKELGQEIDAWVQDQLAASPEWAPEVYVSILQHLETDAPTLHQSG